MSGNFFNVGNALESLETAKNNAAEQQFQDQIENIQDEANEKLTLYGDIEKGGGTLLGGIAGVKTAVAGIKKLKGKLGEVKDAIKNKGKSLEEIQEDGEGVGGDVEEGVNGLTDNLTETAQDLTSNITDGITSATDNITSAAQNAVSNIGNTAENLISNATNTIQDGITSATQTLSNGMDGVVNSGRSMLNNLVRSGQSGGTQEVEMSNLGNRDVEMNELGGRTEALPDEEPALRQNAFHERINYDTDRVQGRLGQRTGATREVPDEEQMAEDQPDKEAFPEIEDDEAFEDPAAEFGGTQPEGIANITTDTTMGVPGIDTAGEVIGEGVGEAVDEAAGAALDATGIGAIIGIPLQILGLVGAGASLAAGIFGSDAASAKETQQTQAAQAQEAAAKAKPADVAGRIAPQIQTAAQRTVGGY